MIRASILALAVTLSAGSFAEARWIPPPPCASLCDPKAYYVDGDAPPFCGDRHATSGLTIMIWTPRNQVRGACHCLRPQQPGPDNTCEKDRDCTLFVDFQFLSTSLGTNCIRATGARSYEVEIAYGQVVDLTEGVIACGDEGVIDWTMHRGRCARQGRPICKIQGVLVCRACGEGDPACRLWGK